MRLIQFMLAAAVTAALGCANQRDQSSREMQVSPDELVCRITQLPLWQSEDLSHSEWQDYLCVASEMQSLDDSRVSSVLSVASAKDHAYGRRAYVLVRILLDMSNCSPPSGFTGWAIRPNREDAPSSGGWPVEWTGHQPRIIAECYGYSGPPYDAGREYLDLLKAGAVRRTHQAGRGGVAPTTQSCHRPLL